MPRRCPLAPLVDRTRTPLGPYWTRARDMSNAQPAERRKCVSPAFVFRAPCVSPWSSRPTARVPLPRLIAHFTSPVKRRSLFRAKAPPQAPLEPVNVNYRAQVRNRAVSCPLVTPTRNLTRGPSSRHDTQMFLNSPDAFVFPPFANAGHRPDPPPPERGDPKGAQGSGGGGRFQVQATEKRASGWCEQQQGFWRRHRRQEWRGRKATSY